MLHKNGLHQDSSITPISICKFNTVNFYLIFKIMFETSLKNRKFVTIKIQYIDY